MTRISVFTSGPDDWQALLADPKEQWRIGYSARTLAHYWEAAEGFPPEVPEALQRTDEPALKDLTPVPAIPEFKVPLPGGVRPSQNGFSAWTPPRGVVQRIKGNQREHSSK